MSRLGADLLLYKASLAHNLPVMCQALALGADKGWRNPEDENRTYLHQAVISVSQCDLFKLKCSSGEFHNQ